MFQIFLSDTVGCVSYDFQTDRRVGSLGVGNVVVKIRIKPIFHIM